MATAAFCLAVTGSRVPRCRRQAGLPWLFKEYGLPQYIRTDNGVPFATNTLARLSRLSAWWVRLGVLPQLIEPASRNRMAAMNACTARSRPETTRPPAAMGSQQVKFDRFRREFNHERPHEALEQELQARLSAFTATDAEQVATVGVSRSIRSPLCQCQWRNPLESHGSTSRPCIGEYVGLEEIDDGIWNVYFGALD